MTSIAQHSTAGLGKPKNSASFLSFQTPPLRIQTVSDRGRPSSNGVVTLNPYLSDKIF